MRQKNINLSATAWPAAMIEFVNHRKIQNHRQYSHERTVAVVVFIFTAAFKWLFSATKFLQGFSRCNADIEHFAVGVSLGHVRRLVTQ